MNSNYFTIHKNKKPKKAKYSKPYSKLQLQKMKECTQYFINEIQKINIDSNFLNLRGLKNDSIPSHIRLVSPIPKGEFSIWKKGSHLYSLIYLCWDDICVLHDLYIKNEIYPIAICNSNPESGNIYPENIRLKESNWPKYIIGHCNKISETFIEIGKVEYYGNYSANSTLYKNPNTIKE